jgi:hypothetical protein
MPGAPGGGRGPAGGQVGFTSALVLLIGAGFSPWVELLFPAWILALSIDILVAGLRRPAGASASGSAGDCGGRMVRHGVIVVGNSVLAPG